MAWRRLSITLESFSPELAKTKRAWETFPIALGIQKKISLDNPTNPKFGVDLSRTHHNFGFLLTEMENGKRLMVNISKLCQ